MKSAILKMMLLAGVAALAWAQAARAVVTIDFVPSPPVSVVAGDTFSVDIEVSGLESDGLDEIVAAYDLDVTYDPAVLDWSFVTQYLGSFGNPDLLVGAEFSDGVLDLWLVSFLFDDELAALQGDSVTLATVGFTAIADGAVALGFRWDEFNDVKGRDNGVLIPSAAPEPGTLALAMLGLAGLGYARRRRP
jgi:hypothetical protein